LIKNLRYKIGRRIKDTEGLDKLRWGYQLGGRFNLKEAYRLVVEHANLPKQNIWLPIWKQKLWPNIFVFLQLLVRGKL